MKIDNYAVSMNAQYYNLQFESVEAKISTTSDDFINDKSSDIKKVTRNEDNLQKIDDKLTLELSKSILKNLHSESQRLVGDRVEISSTYVEAQALNFSVDAIIHADGKEIALSLDVSLSRSFVQSTKITRDLVAEPLKDPLVISLDGTMPSLSSKSGDGFADLRKYDDDKNGWIYSF